MRQIKPDKELNESQIFSLEEADNWFDRNKNALDVNYVSQSVHIIIKTLSKYSNVIENILEVGCANAIKLEQLVKTFNSNGYGLDPSEKAISDAKARLKPSDNFELKVGVASSLPFATESMDIVFLGFFLYLVDRSELGQTILEAHRVLKHGGFLVIEDFDYGEEISKTYVHHQSITTYKKDYARQFQDDFSYFLVEKHSYSHSGEYFVKDRDERVSVQILWKPDGIN